MGGVFAGALVVGWSVPAIGLVCLVLGCAVTDRGYVRGLSDRFWCCRGALLIMLIVAVRYHLGGFMLYGLLFI